MVLDPILARLPGQEAWSEVDTADLLVEVHELCSVLDLPVEDVLHEITKHGRLEGLFDLSDWPKVRCAVSLASLKTWLNKTPRNKLQHKALENIEQLAEARIFINDGQVRH